MEDLQRLPRPSERSTRGAPWAVALLLSVLLWVAVLALLVALLG